MEQYIHCLLLTTIDSHFAFRCEQNSTFTCQFRPANPYGSKKTLVTRLTKFKERKDAFFINISELLFIKNRSLRNIFMFCCGFGVTRDLVFWEMGNCIMKIAFSVNFLCMFAPLPDMHIWF